MTDSSRNRIDLLADQFGMPLYIFDERGFTENYHRLDSAMSSLYGKYRIAYSYKTNYTPYICLVAKKLGAYAEVVSGMEYALAKRIGYDDSQIIFNGPDKADEGIEAFRKGCIINIDSLDELENFCEEAKAEPNSEYKLGFRVNLNIGQGFVSRFGMDESDLEKAFQRTSQVSNLRIAGLHFHISRCRSMEAWRSRTEQMLKLSDRLFKAPPEYLDLGSGMYGSMAPEFSAQFSDVPTYEEYAQVTTGIVAEHYKGEEGPLLITEPGTTLINRFVECVVKVDAIKSIRGKKFAILNGSMHNLGEVCILKRLPVKIIPGGEEQITYSSIDLTGYTCLEQDILLSSFEGRLAKDDYIVFENVGGYSTVLKPPFIRPSCAIVAETSAGDYKLIKEVETAEDVFRNYVFEDEM